MAYKKASAVLERLDPTQIKLFTNLSDGIPLSKPVEMEITSIDETELNLVVHLEDSFGHKAKQRLFLMDRQGLGYSFGIRQMIASITNSNNLFKHLMGVAFLKDWSFSEALMGLTIKAQFELGSGFYIAGHMSKFVILDENYQMLNDTNYDTLADARIAALGLGYKEGWPQLTTFVAPKTSVQMHNTILIETFLGDTYAGSDDPDDIHGQSVTDSEDSDETQTDCSADKVERDGHSKISSALPESKRF